MKRFPILGVLLLIPAMALLVVTGCTKDDGKTDKDKTAPSAADKGNKPGAELKKIEAPTDGIVKGVVKLKGTLPTPMSEEDIIKKHSDAKFCLTGKAKDIYNVSQQTWIGKDGGVGNVIIILEPAEGKTYDIKSDLKEKWKKHKAVIDQPFCQYIPHAMPIYADVQPLVFTNKAKVTHNVKIDGGVMNGDTNHNMPPGEDYVRGILKYDHKPVPVSCSAHTWMNARIITVKHPYFAVTKEDGSFEIKDVPVGEELRVMMWHESFEKAKEVQKITAKKGDNSLDLSISK